MNKVLTTTLLSLSLACGSADSTDLFDNGSVADAGVELGHSEQELMSGYTGSLQFGFKPVSEASCVWGDPNQTCIVPRYKDLRFHITGGNSAKRQVIRLQALSWYGSMVSHGLSQESDGWSFSESGDINDPGLTLIIDVDTGSGFCPGTGNDIQDYSCFSGSTIHLTENPGIYGNYVRWSAVPVLHIDFDEIQSIPGLTDNQKTRVHHQAIWSGLLRFVGSGLVTAGDNRCNKSTILSNAYCFVTDAQACAAHSFGDEGNQGTWLFGGVECGQ